MNPSKGVILLVSKLSPSSSTTSNVSSQSLMDFLLSSSPSSLSAVSKTSSLSSSTSNIKKRLVLDSPDNQCQPKKKAHCIKSMMKQEPKLAAYDVDWFNSTSTKNKCLKHTSDKNLPVTQEGQLTFLLDKYQTSKIKMAFVVDKTVTKENTSTPPKMTATEKKNGKSGLKCQKENPSKGVVLLVSKLSPSSSNASNVSS